MKIILATLTALLAVANAQRCMDHHRLCGSYAQAGLCEFYPTIMQQQCPLSCALCTPDGDGDGTDPEPDVECGVSTAQGSRIIGGQKAKKDAWPWQVSIYYGNQFMCGGSVLNSRWILTAAHCVDGFDYRYYTIVVGDYNRQTRDGDEQAFRAVRAFHHPNWMKPTPLNNDVALIELDGRIKYNNHVKPVCMPKAHHAVPVGTKCYITGWGQYTVGQSGPPTTILKQSPLNVVSKKQCENKNTRNMQIPVTNNMVCAGLGPNTINTGCHGDSGGPFVCRSGSGKWILQGSVSWGSGFCDASEGYTVFARLSELRPWIEKYATLHDA